MGTVPVAWFTKEQRGFEHRKIKKWIYKNERTTWVCSLYKECQQYLCFVEQIEPLYFCMWITTWKGKLFFQTKNIDKIILILCIRVSISKCPLKCSNVTITASPFYLKLEFELYDNGVRNKKAGVLVNNNVRS